MWVFCGGLPLRGAECTRVLHVAAHSLQASTPFISEQDRWVSFCSFVQLVSSFRLLEWCYCEHSCTSLCLKCLNSSLKLGVECYKCTLKFPSAMLSHKIKFMKQPYHLAIGTKCEENQLDSWPCCRPAPLNCGSCRRGHRFAQHPLMELGM